jgi:hypothetical protein
MSSAKAYMLILSRQSRRPTVLGQGTHSFAIPNVAVKIDKRQASRFSSGIHNIEDRKSIAELVNLAPRGSKRRIQN